MKAVTVLRKPLEGTVAHNCLDHGCGALNIDGCRIGTLDNLNGGAYAKDGKERHDGYDNWRYKREGGAGEFEQPSGRWPANVILRGSEAVRAMDKESGIRKTTWISPSHQNNRDGDFLGAVGHPGSQGYNDSGTASRFFKQVKK